MDAQPPDQTEPVCDDVQDGGCNNNGRLEPALIVGEDEASAIQRHQKRGFAAPALCDISPPQTAAHDGDRRSDQFHQKDCDGDDQAACRKRKTE